MRVLHLSVAALIFWSYLGYENVSNVAEEFKNPEQDFHRSILGSVILIGFLYFSIAFVTVGTLAYKTGGSVAPFVGKLAAAGIGVGLAGLLYSWLRRVKKVKV